MTKCFVWLGFPQFSAASENSRLLYNCSAVHVSGGTAGQVWSIGGDPAGCAQCDGRYVLVASARQARQLCQRNTVLHCA